MIEIQLTEIMLFLLTGSVAGVLAGLLGVGGGLFIVPMLLFLLPFIGIDSAQLMTICVATSLATIVITSISSVFAHHKKGGILWPVFWRFVPGLVIGSFLGSYLADIISQQFLKSLFGVSVILISINMIFQLKPKQSIAIPKQFFLTLASTFIGTLSTMIGIGGGALTVPTLSHWQTPMVKAVATSAACGLPIAIAGTIGFIIAGLDQSDLPQYTTGYVYWPAVLGIISSSVIFAPIGAKIAHKISAPLLKRTFAIFLFIVGINVLL